MSGGSHDYICYKIEDSLVGQMHDAEMDEMVKDFAKLCHDLEWYDSSDYGWDDYHEALVAFKKKWFGNTEERTERLKGYINDACKKLKDELMQMIGETDK